MARVSPCIRVVEIQQKRQSGSLDSCSQRHCVIRVVDVVVWVRVCLSLAAREQTKPHAINPVIFENLNPIPDLSGILIRDAE